MFKNMNKLAMICTLGVLLLLVAATVTIFGHTSASAHEREHFKLAFAQLNHQPHGTADLKWNPKTTNLTVTITMNGLAPSSTHPAHIHLGNCNVDGAVAYPLSNVVADKHGVGWSTTTIAKVANGIPASGWYINVHNGPGLSPADQHMPISCGNIYNSHASTKYAQYVKAALGVSSIAPDQAAYGVSFMTLNDDTLTVYVVVHGLVPNSQHAAHIHAGSCESQGGVLYMLPNLTADAQGNAFEEMSFHHVESIPASGWYVNVHYSTMLSTQTGFDPIACGNVKLH